MKRFTVFSSRRQLPCFMLSALLISALSGCGIPHIAFASPAKNQSNDYLLHFPGIAGEQYLDRDMLRGLRRGGFDGAAEVYDWTAGDPGFGALYATKRNKVQAQEVADRIEARCRSDPKARIMLTGHSGGAGVLIWALEKLPDDVYVDSVLLLAPALSPTYDLTCALGHVRDRIYVFTSPNDLFVLGFGTTVFRTIDGFRGDAAGRIGFRRPKTADPEAYEKLVNVPYAARWMNDGNIGDHIGSMSKRFAKNVLAPLLRGELPMAGDEKRRGPSTRPSDPDEPRATRDGDESENALD